MTFAKLLGLIACFLGVGVVLLAGEAKPPQTGTGDTETALMRAKLASSQRIVEGLMARDFKLVQNGAQDIQKICDATEWHAEEDQVYAHYRAELQRTAKKLALLAEGKNQDGAAYTYMHSITICMSCHDYCRDVLHVAREEPNLQATPLPQTGEKPHRGSVRR
jgi:hypothetical protein